jgi:flagellar motility protein MotE (MotC chaperone)
MKLSATPTMSRDEALAIYNDLQSAMNSMIRNVQGEEKKVTKTPSAPTTSKEASPPPLFKPHSSRAQRVGGGILIALALSKVAFLFAELGGAIPVEATMMSQSSSSYRSGYSKAEEEVLKSLDNRRVELEARRDRLDQRERDLKEKERAFSVSLIELKELTSRLRGERDKEYKKKEAQMAQLANVYGAMNPPEAAILMDQLDTHTALSLLERMPEKRIGQVLPLMKPERALMLTQMMSGKAGQK